MRRRKQCAAICMLAIMSASVMMSTAAMAEELAETAVAAEESGASAEAAAEEGVSSEETAETASAEESSEAAADTQAAEESQKTEAELVAVSTDLEGCWNQVAIVNPDNVTTGINIRSEADQNSEILGFLYEGCAVWVLEKGDMWTEFYSNGITGYVMNDYLLYGESVSALAPYYAAQGVRTEWDGVIAYTSADGASAEAAVLTAGKSFALLADEGHWLKIQLDSDTVAYVSSEDVSRVTLFEPATPKNGDRVRLGGLAVTASESYEEYTEPEETYVSDTDYTAETSAQTEYYYTPETSAQTEYYAPETSAQTETAAQTETTAQTEYVQETEAATEAAATEITDSSDEVIEDGDGGYYDADTDTYYDGNGNVIETTVTYAAELETEEAQYYEETSAYTEETSQTYAETEAVSTEAASTEASSTATTASTDDTTLLAALIYCEAGNQSYEGMVAVGAVVMNRVYSSSFPNTISEVIYQSGQFTPASSGALASALANGVPSTCYEAAAAAISGENPVGSALYFNTTAGTGTKIGDHWFY